MVEIKINYICDLCGGNVEVVSGTNMPRWAVRTDVGDLCPRCSELWDKAKKEFLLRNRKEVQKVRNKCR